MVVDADTSKGNHRSDNVIVARVHPAVFVAYKWGSALRCLAVLFRRFQEEL